MFEADRRSGVEKVWAMDGVIESGVDSGERQRVPVIAVGNS